MNTDYQRSKQEACFAHANQVWLLSITTSVSLLANESDIRSALHGQVSLAAVNDIVCDSCGYERLQKCKESLKKACFENVNIM